MEYKCNHCNKDYASYQSRCNHIRRYHKSDLNENNTIMEKIKKKTYICDKCNLSFINLEKITEHSKNDCRPSVKANNIYKFKTETFGKNKYEAWKGGDIYIIQTEFNLKCFYKIGITTNLYKRLGQYRCGAVLEPKLHYYYPCKNIKETDKILKAKLQKYNVKREIYRSDNIDDLRNLIKDIQKESNSSVMEIIPENKECDIQGCEHCDLYFTNQQDLIIHVKNIHPEKICKEDIIKSIKIFKNNNVFKSELELIKKQMEEEKKELEKLINKLKENLEEIKTLIKKLIWKTLKIHPKNFYKLNTFEKINEFIDSISNCENKLNDIKNIDMN